LATIRLRLSGAIRRVGGTSFPLPRRTGIVQKHSSEHRSRDSVRDIQHHGAALLEKLSELSKRVHTARLPKFDPQRAECWFQHYGIPTSLIDLTSDPNVALHFAADTDELVPSHCVVYRIDFQAIEHKVYGRAGRPTPLSAPISRVPISRGHFARKLGSSALTVAILIVSTFSTPGICGGILSGSRLRPGIGRRSTDLIS
jgi:FRG domain